MVVICDKLSKNPASFEKYNNEFEKYPYPLSDFQKYAIEAILEGHHVLVTAHTGSGKTLPAEFAIQYFTQKKKKVIYTTPIKALSNQKYYEFSQKYPEISFGLFTGDIKTNPEADVLIMTTEILMNALFHVSQSTNTQFQIDIPNDLAAVVFDEVHYINDPERGQNWEKTLLMLPKQVQRIMLSATIDSPERFAEWCERASQGGIVYVASTNKRVVPLTHYSFMTISESILKGIKDKSLQQEIKKQTNEIIPIQNDKGIFQESGYKTIQKISEFLENHAFLKRKFVLNQLVLFLKNREMLPAIGFVFSRKNVELCAQEITVPLLEDDSKIPYIVRRECEQIVRKLPNYEEYLRLPEYISLVSLLEKGIGIHHSGMIPVLREIVELLISKKYIKLLFATESFAIGLDCPIKTAIFTGIQKFDGNNERYLMSHEYTQMAGRAGRRGIDTIGHVVHCNNLFRLPTQTEYKEMMGGKPQSLVSKFRISYSLVLNIFHSFPEITNTRERIIEKVFEFTKKSMIYDELWKAIENQRQTIDRLKIEMEKKQNSILRTPKDICQQYILLERELPKSINKKRKEIQREIQTWKEQYHFIEIDSKQVKEGEEFERNFNEKEIPHLHFLENYMTEQIEKVWNVLEKEQFVEIQENQYRWTSIGKAASNLSEVHSLIWAKCIVKEWNYFSDFSTKQIIGIVSCITDIKVSQEYKMSIPTTNDRFVKEKIQQMIEMYRKYEDIECFSEMRTGICYENPLSFDIIDEAIQWCDCDSEEECKWFIQTKLQEKEISIGDFTKAMMKIATTTKEFATIVSNEDGILLEEHTAFLYKLSQIDSLILKYIATSQSLYV